MAEIMISLPDPLAEFAKTHATDGDIGEYVSQLLLREQRRQAAVEELRVMLEKAEASGISKRTLPEIMQGVEEKMRADGRL